MNGFAPEGAARAANVFITWSQPRSHAVALILRDWLPAVLPGAEPWVSSEDIDKGARWTAELGMQLRAAQFGIICLVPENLTEPWVIYEAGVLGHALETGRVAPLLLGVEMVDVPAPLKQFQCTVFGMKEMWKLVQSVNRAIGAPGEAFRDLFKQRWPGLRERVRTILDPRPVSDTPRLVVERPRRASVASIPTELTPPLEAVLKFLARQSEPLSADLVASATSQTDIRAKYHLDELLKRGLVNYRLVVGVPPAYYLTSAGLAHVVENDLDID